MPPTLLLVDDERDVTEALRMVLALRGFTVRIAASGWEAVAAVEAAVPDLVLLDLRLPGTTGWEVLPQLRRLAATLRVVLITGRRVDREMERRALDAGALGILSKPIRVEALLAAIHRFLGEPPRADPRGVIGEPPVF